MRVIWFVLLILVAAPVLAAQSGSGVPADGLAILEKMSERYASAKVWHIEATDDQATTNAFSRIWTRTQLAGAVSGNRYRFEGRGGYGSALLVSDGKTPWDWRSEDWRSDTRAYNLPDRRWPATGRTTAQRGRGPGARVCRRPRRHATV